MTTCIAKYESLAEKLIASLSQAHQDLLPTLPGIKDCPATRMLWIYWLSMCEVPRVSHKMEPIQAWVKARAAEFDGVDLSMDKVGNVMLRIEPSPGYKPPGKSPYVVMQGHMDMVCSCNATTEHDFDTEPIIVRWSEENEGWLCSVKGTTLGADDGMGVAMCMSMAALVSIARSGAEGADDLWKLLPQRAADARDGKIMAGLECLLTVNEETDMSGALEIDRNGFVKADRLLNIDTEEEHGICIGCAGGFEQKLEMPMVPPQGVDPATLERFDYAVKGLMGGHSGMDINKPRASAIDLAVRLGVTITSKIKGSLLAAIEAGTAVNTIARECTASLLIPSASADEARAIFKAEWAKYLDEYDDSDETVDDVADGMVLELNTRKATAEDLASSADRGTTRRALSMLHSLPHGVLRQSPMNPEHVETSCNFAIVSTEGGKIMAHLFARSSRVSQLEDTQQLMESIAVMSGATITEPFSVFPGWTPKPKSQLLSVVVEAYKKSYATDKKPSVYSIHAGLECGILVDAYPGMQAVSWGPTIRDAHTPDESLLAETVPRVTAFTLAALAMM